MKLLNLLIDEEVLKAEIELENATADNVLERAKVYLALLLAFRKQLHTFARITVRRTVTQPSTARVPSEPTHDTIEIAIGVAESEILRVEKLLDSLTRISPWEAAQIFNRVGFRGSRDWEAAANEVRTSIGTERLAAEDAIEKAGLLLRQEYATSRPANIIRH